jgi:hypothetical protein
MSFLTDRASCPGQRISHTRPDGVPDDMSVNGSLEMRPPRQARAAIGATVAIGGRSGRKPVLAQQNLPVIQN